jgi:hypothetical protein
MTLEVAGVLHPGFGLGWSNLCQLPSRARQDHHAHTKARHDHSDVMAQREKAGIASFDFFIVKHDAADVGSVTTCRRY